MIDVVLAFLIRLAAGPNVRAIAPLEGNKPRVFFANHSSHLDFLVIWATLPRKQRLLSRPVAARDYWASGRLRRYLSERVFRALLIERLQPSEEEDPIGQMVAVLDEGDSLILFPEGTRGSGEEVARFRAGLYNIHLARPGVALVPVYLDNLNRILPKGESVPVPLLSRVTFGGPLVPVPGEGRSEFLSRARDTLAALEEPSP
jgi:1-acyl-sn-glycerol-3-phosphate acyltransferase